MVHIYVYDELREGNRDGRKGAEGKIGRFDRCGLQDGLSQESVY
jgi:hypothetical protein